MRKPMHKGVRLPAYRVRPISFLEAQRFIVEHHYARGMHNGPTAMFGLFAGGAEDGQGDAERLIGACVFATPISENVRRSVWGKEHRGRVTELHRFVVQDVTPPNAESAFISRCLSQVKEIRPDLWGVVSFADTTFGHVGTVYQASNAFYTGESKGLPYYLDPATGRRRTRRQCGHNVTAEEAAARGWIRKQGGIKHRYLLMLPDDRHHARRLREDLQLPLVVPYPKLGYTAGRTPVTLTAPKAL